MVFRVLVTVGLVGFGYLLGREAGRAAAIRQHLGSSDRQRRVGGETFESKDYTVLDDTKASDSGKGAVHADRQEGGNG